MLRTRAVAAITAAGLVAALATPLRGQSLAAGGAIEGTLVDESGGVLPGASIGVRNQATGVVRETASDEIGSYHALLLPVGRYDLTASLPGFASLKRSGLVVGIGQTLTVNLTLELAGAQETVVVTAEAPLLELKRTHVAYSVGERSVANLPVNGRNFIDFVLTTPGVTRDTRAGDISFAGQRGTLNSLVIDGADNNNTFFGQSLGRTGSGRAPYQFSQDAVQEFQVNSSAYSAEYGRAGGAVINVVTKSGTNDFHGSAFEFFRDEGLNANSYNNKVVVPERPRSAFRIHQFGASLGGPVVKGKAFFFLSYDGQRQSIPNDVILNLPANLPGDPDTQAGLAILQEKADSYSLTRDQDVFLAKLDWQLDNTHRVTLRYNHQDFSGANNENSGTASALEHTGSSNVGTRTLNASLASAFGPTLFNELRAQYARDQEPGEANSDDPEANVRQGGQTVLIFGRNFFSPRETTIKRVQVADSLTLVRGRHSFKLGADYNHDSILNFFPGNFGGRYFFNSLAALGRGRPDGPGESYQQAFAGAGTSGPTTHPDSSDFAVFVQDEWRVRKDLALTLGLRYDVQSFAQPPLRNPDPQLAAAGIDTSFIKTDKNNFGPRLGAAWTVNPKTVVRGGYGIFYGRTPAIMAAQAHSQNGVNVQTLTFTGASVPTYPATLSAVPPGITPPKPSIQFFDPDFQNPTVHQASAGVEYALTPETAVSASYIFVAGRNLPRSRDFNVAEPIPVELAIQGGGSITVQRFPDARPFTSFDRIVRFESTADSTYNGINLELRKRFGGRLQASLAYTLGHVTDTVPDATNVVLGGSDDARFPSNPVDFEVDRADGNVDVRQRLVLSGYWDLAYWKQSSGFRRALLDGWSMSWIASLQTGLPYSERVANDLNNDGNRSNDLVPGRRNVQRLPTAYNIDLRLSKKIPLGSRVKLEIIGEAFNLLNSTNVSARRDTLYNFTNGVLVPQTGLSNPRLDFGADSSAQVNFQDTQRIVQVAGKITF
jgi:outer membrane receptor protein involved in Fe transport